MLNQEWDIKPRGSNCCKCLKDFAESQCYISRLDFGRSGYGRSDFCAECWAGRDENNNTLSVWRGVYKSPDPPPEEPLKKETAESLLRHLMEEDDNSRTNVKFILAVMLERRRVFVERDVRKQQDGSMTRVYEHRHSGETFVIEDPMLRLDQLESVQKEVLAMLEQQQ